MKYTIDSAGVHFDISDEIPIPEAVAEMERISAQLAAALNPCDVRPTDEQRERILARVMNAAQCECEQSGLRKCGQCE